MSYDRLPFDFYVGLDLGQKQDYTALVVVECPIWVNSRWQTGQALPDGWVQPSDYHPNARQLLRSMEQRFGGLPGKPVLRARHVQRFPLGTSYPVIIEQVSKLMATPPLDRGAVLLVDATGVGQPVVDQFRHAGLQLYAVTITGGREVASDGAELHVPKRDLVSATQVTLQTGRLRIAEQLPDAPKLVEELLNFRVKITAAANDTYGAWREGSHDDLVLALSMAVWFREWFNVHLDERLVARSATAA